LLSDEGVIATPYYPYTTPAVATPVSFAVVNENSGNLRIVSSPQTDVTHYLVQTSTDGTVFNPPVQYHKDSLLLTGLNPNQPVFLKMAAKTAYNTSAYSEVLGGVPSACQAPVLIVNAFDRATTGNTFDFIRQHGKAFFANGFGFVSCTNEALVNGLVTAGDYRIMDVILGEESTVNETFSTQEQLITTDYLKQGGCLFVSGAETAWDLDHLGSAADKDFYNNYLKAAYANDAPNGQNGVYYTAQPATNSIFAGMGPVSYDNGTQGTYNVRYPDVISPLNGAVACLEYSTLTAQYAGVSFSGLFPQGSKPAKLVNLGIPFETFYPESKRNSIIGDVLTFFNVPPSGIDTPVITLVNDTLFSDWSGLQQWYLNGMPLSGATGSFYKPLQNGDYYVIAGEGNCYSGHSNILTVVISDADNSVGLSFSFVIYPNPVEDVLNIVFPAYGLNKQILIYDVYGKLVFSSSSTLTHESIYMGALAKGLYFIEIYMGYEMPVVRRIVKQ